MRQLYRRPKILALHASWPAKASHDAYVNTFDRWYYLKATGQQHYLLLNFGKPHLEIKRAVHVLQAALNHLRVLRASLLIGVEILPSPAVQQRQ
jgi:hypothetical protein